MTKPKNNGHSIKLHSGFTNENLQYKSEKRLALKCYPETLQHVLHSYSIHKVD